MTDAPRVLVVIDLQRVVGPGGPWEIPGVEAVLPAVGQLMDAFGADTVVTRHRLAPSGAGQWTRYAQRWARIEEEPSWWELLDEVAAGVPDGAAVADKTVYSALGAEALHGRVTRSLARGEIPELVVAGCETDCCVAATMFAAVDAGAVVTLADDALVGPDPTGHEGLLASARRLPEQVRVTSSTEAIRARFLPG